MILTLSYEDIQKAITDYCEEQFRCHVGEMEIGNSSFVMDASTFAKVEIEKKTIYER